ncbi:hypothetical protein NKG05_06220 [Oerskovia sp. M15]
MVGIPDPEWGQRVVAVVTRALSPGGSPRLPDVTPRRSAPPSGRKRTTCCSAGPGRPSRLRWDRPPRRGSCSS